MWYLRYKKADMISMFLGMLVWTSLSTFMLVAKNAIGVDNIPIFETLIFLSGIIAIYISYSKKDWDYSKIVAIDIGIETMFLITLLYLLYFGTLAQAGVSVYAVIILMAVSGKLKNVASRDIEDRVLKSIHYKGYLRELRKLTDNFYYVAGALGTGVALLFITYLKVDIIAFTKVAILLNVAQNIYDYIVWYKYLYKKEDKKMVK